MSYQVKVYLPTQKTTQYIDELKNKDILTITKFIKANDDNGLSKYLKKIISKSGAQNIVDMFFVILQLRALNFNNNVILKGNHTNGSEATYKQSIFEFLGEFITYAEQLPNEFNFKKEELEIIFTFPKKLYFKNFLTLLTEIITDIKINNESILTGLDAKEKFQIIYQLNNETVSEIKDFLNNINQNSSLFFIKNDNKDLSFPNIKISFFNNTIFNVIKSIFKIEVSYFYNRLFICLTKLGMSFSDFMSLTYIETDILLNIYKSANKIK